MPTACITQPDSTVHLKSERLEITGWNEAHDRKVTLREIPMRDLDRLILNETVQITSQAMAALLRSDIPISILGWNGQCLGAFLPATNAHGLARLCQYRRIQDSQFLLQMAGRIVTAKIYNQRRVIQRLALNRSENPAAIPIEDAAPTLAWLDSIMSILPKAANVDELRGYEGASTARYFQAWAKFLPDEFPFERRSTRPPLNPVNACISFGATLLYAEAVAFIHAHGLDPALGLLHATENGRWSLALDLIEPFRPALVEALALDLFSHQILEPAHFEPKNGGVYLNDTGRKKFILQYERRMERQFLSEAVDCRTTLRQQLEAQAVMFKAALEEPTRFEPFLIN